MTELANAAEAALQAVTDAEATEASLKTDEQANIDALNAKASEATAAATDAVKKQEAAAHDRAHALDEKRAALAAAGQAFDAAVRQRYRLG